MRKPKVAVIYFPGNNCEEESLQAVLASGMDGQILRWNQRKEVSKFDGFIIPGGWAYEDRIRAGVIAAKDPVFDVIRKEVENGKPVFGICNGAQALVETGMIPGLQNKIEMALAPNKNPFIGGYYCTWVFIKNASQVGKTAFTRTMEKDEVIPIPIAHGEGRFATKDKDLLNKLVKNDQITFRYSTKEGTIQDEFPTNPNGAIDAIAAISNKKGNVMAMMPHPERASFIRNLPDNVDLKNKSQGDVRLMESPAPAMKFFTSMKNYIEEEVI